MAFEIDTVAKRARLSPRKNPYWVGIAGGRGGVSLGYRRRARAAGVWVAKAIVRGERAEERVGWADDAEAPVDAVSYRTAVALALDWNTRQHATLESAGRLGRSRSAPTVRTAIEDYCATRARRSEIGGANAKSRLVRHVLSDAEFAGTRLSNLRAVVIESWRERLTASEEKKAAAVGGASAMSATSANRLLNDVRAALNASALRHRRELPAHIFQEIKLGTKAVEAVSQARRQLLTDEQVRAAVLAAFEVDEAGDFGRLVAVLAATGARHSQAAALDVSDLQSIQRRVMMPSSRKGRNWTAKPPIAVPLSADVLDFLVPAAAGRSLSAPLLERWSFRRTGKSTWSPDKRRRWGHAYEIDRWWPEVVKRAGLPRGTVMYALRHSSIVRGLRAMLPVRLVAALHDTSVEMIERHYSAFIVDVTDDLARRAMLSIAPSEKYLVAA